MVVDVEVSGKAGTGEPRLVPRTIVTLGLHEIGHAAFDGCGAFSRGEQADERPSGLGGGGRPTAPV